MAGVDQTVKQGFGDDGVRDLYLRRYRLNIPYSDGQHMLIYHADPTVRP